MKPRGSPHEIQADPDRVVPARDLLKVIDMKRTGIKKLELKRLTVKQLQEVSGSGHRINNMTVSMTCTCTMTSECVIVDDANHHACDLQQFGMCDGSCVSSGGGGGGCGGGCGGGSANEVMNCV